MNIHRIVSELKGERQLLDDAIKAIEGIGGSGKGQSRSRVVSISSGTRRRPRLSAAARRRISEAQKRRWARVKKAA